MSELTREEALSDLLANPAGSVRDWAKRWGWSKSSTHRFLKELERDHVFTFSCGKPGTVGTRVPKSGTLKPDSSAVSVPKSCYLGTLDKLQVPRYERSLETDRLITALNEGLTVGLGKQFKKPIKGDNRGSIQAAGKILAKVPLDRAVDLVGQAGRIFNPSHSGGKMPRSLGHPFFTRFVFNESKRIDRALAKEQLELLPEIEMQVERTPHVSPPPFRPYVETRRAPAAMNDAVARYMAAFEEGQKTKARQ